jgi:hypothetical protein
MLTGVYAARNIIGEHYDVWSVNTEMEYHEEERATETKVGDRLVPVRVTLEEAASTSSPDEIIAAAFAKLDPVALGVAVGVVSGLVLFLITAALLLKGGPEIGPNLSLLRHYLPGFKMMWSGGVIGFLEVGVGGFLLGYVGAWLRNWGMTAYATLGRRRAEARAQRDLLDRV